MFGNDPFAQFEAGYQSSLAQRTAQQQRQVKKPEKKKGNFFTNLLPTVGGIGGSVGGAAIGTALLPGVGTLAGALLGGALGGGTGKVAENAAEGEKLTSGVAGEAALSGVLGAGPLRLAKMGVDTVRGVKAGAGLADALKAGGTAAKEMSLTRSLGNKLNDSGQKLIAKEFRLNPTQQANFSKLHGEEATSVLRRYGVKKPEDLRAKIQPLQDAFDNVITTIPDVSKAELATGLKKIYQPLTKSPAIFERNLGTQVKQQADELLKLAKRGTLPASKVNELRKTFDAAVNYTQKGAPEYNVIKKTADALRGTLQTAADKAGVKTAEGQSFKKAGKELRKLYGLDEIVGKQSYLGSGSLPLSLPQLLGGGLGAASGGLPGAAAGIVGTQMLNSNAARRLAAKGTLKAGEKLTQKGQKKAGQAYSVKGVAGRVAPIGIAQALNDQLSEGNNMDVSAPSTNTAITPNASNITDVLSQNTGDLSSVNPYPQENLLFDIQRDPQNADEYMAYYQSLQEIFAQPQEEQLSSEAAKNVSNAQTGLQALADFQAAIDQDPNVLAKRAIPGRGMLGGALGSALGTRGADAAAQQIVDVIARLRTGAAITNDEARRFEGFIPQAFDSPEVRQQKLNYLANQFQMVAQRGASSQPSSLEEAMIGSGAF